MIYGRSRVETFKPAPPTTKMTVAQCGGKLLLQDRSQTEPANMMSRLRAPPFELQSRVSSAQYTTHSDKASQR